jgi:hypothetical protein
MANRSLIADSRIALLCWREGILILAAADSRTAIVAQRECLYSRKNYKALYREEPLKGVGFR